MKRQTPHRFGRQARVNEHPREIGEPSQRVVERAVRNASSASISSSPGQTHRQESEKHEYAELHCLSNFSFQRGASSAQELFERAKKLGYAALAITDECSLSGIVRAYEASNDTGIALIVGTEIQLADGPKLVVLAADHDGYSDICQLITTGRRRSAKGEYQLTCADAERLGPGVRVLWTPRHSALPPRRASDREDTNAATRDEDTHGAWIVRHFAGRAWLAVELHRGPDDAAELARLHKLGARHALPLVAAGDVHMHVRRRRALQDALTAIRLGCTVAESGHALFPNGERHLRRIDTLAEIHPDDLLAETLRIAAQCTFNMKKLKYEYPHELVPAEMPDAAAYLRQLTCAGAAVRWPGGPPAAVREQIDKELALIAELKYEHFFLTVEDIVRWARTRDPPILCQGRGSSANSAVCYCLGVTAVTPESGNLLFERFLSKERNEPPDIDVDFEHERREEVIQYVFNKYGRNRAALAATVISYRRKSAVRDVGRVLGLSDDALDQLTGIVTRVPGAQSPADAMRERGFDPDSRVLRQLVTLVGELRGFPRHLSQHVGGFVISERPLHHLVPVENAAMPDRTIIQWDKDDLETMKLLKVDCLALGMLTCLRKCFDLLRRHAKLDLSLYGIPTDDEKTYDMICRADTVGVFQVESRAQMSMLPRLRPRCFYDLVIEVAIVRPGPIQGNMVHPYLRRRNGQEPIDYPQSKFERDSGRQSSRVKEALERTLGVPIFQEQVMKLIQVVAGFTPGEADELRRAMAAWKRKGGLEKFHDRIRDGMLERGYDEAYFERIFEQIKGFGDYGFPESHAASFALLAWASCWMKNYYPAAFTCALLNSQPMGFYQPAQLIQDAKQHGVRVLPADVTVSTWDCELEQLEPSPPSEPGGEGWARGQHENVYEHQQRSHPSSHTLCVADSGPPNAAPSPQPSPPTERPLGERERSAPQFALRLGLRLIRGLSEATAQRIVAARTTAPFRDVADLTARARLNAGERACLADAGALRSLSGHRHRARWDIAGTEQPLPVLADATINEEQIRLRPPSLREDVMNDYATLGLSLTLHPLALIRPALVRRRVVPARATIDTANHGRRMRCAGLVTVRQHPGTAKGVTFVTLEDETGHVNVVVWQSLAEKQHRVLLESAVMGVDGTLEAVDGVYHLIASRLHDYSALLPELAFASRDFH
jgi:error-prone DNA polymerase